MTEDPRDLETSPGEDFASLLAESDTLRRVALEVGDRVTARVIHLGREDVFCAISPTQEAVLPRLELEGGEGEQTVRVGDEITAYVVSLQHGITLSRKLGRDVIDVETLIAAVRSELPVDGMVTGVNKGGLEVAMGGARAFCPMGQIDLDFVEDPQALVGKTMQFQVKEVRENGRSVVLSRRALLAAERAAKAKTLLEELAVGMRREGVVSRVLDFGAFVDLGGVDGLLPASEISHARIDDPRTAVKEGERVEVVVLRIEPDTKHEDRTRITLSCKALLPEPYTVHRAELTEGAMFQGRVTRIEKYGAFVELHPGLEGLVHVSEMSRKRVRHPADVCKVGDEVSVRVLSVNDEDKRVSLSFKEAVATSATALAPDQLVTGKVERVERYGVFFALEGGASALLPSVESDTPQGADLGKAFPIGSTHELVVLAIDERGRVKVSKRARQAASERAEFNAFKQVARGESSSLGTLGERLGQKLKAR